MIKGYNKATGLILFPECVGEKNVDYCLLAFLA